MKMPPFASLPAGALGSLLAVSGALAQSPAVSDATFVKKAAVGNTFEIEEAKLAEQRALNPRLKEFAKKMLADHGDAMKKLQAAATKAEDPAVATLDAPHQAMLDNLKTFQGVDFDKIYLADQLQAHVEIVSLLSDYKQNGKNSDLLSWTKTALPIVKGHLAAIDGL